jgi:putative transposase
VIVASIEAYKHQFGLSPICRVLSDHDVPIAPGTYDVARSRPPSARQRSDARLLEVVQRVHRKNYGVYGVRKVWHAAGREGLMVGRDQVGRVMRLAGLRGQSRRKRIRTTVRSASAPRSPDLMRPEWSRGPSRV